jgi:hypothetical protein
VSTESHDAKSGQHCRACPPALTPIVHPAQGVEEILGIDAGLLCLVQLIGEDIQHQLAVAVGIKMAVGFEVQVALELYGVDQVAVMGEADAVRAIDIERLGLGHRARSGRGVTYMADAHAPWNPFKYGSVTEDLSNHAVLLVHMQPTSRRGGDNAGSILATVSRPALARAELTSAGSKRTTPFSAIADVKSHLRWRENSAS